MPSTTTKKISIRKFRSMQDSDKLFPAVAERMRIAERDLETIKAENNALIAGIEYWKKLYLKCFEENIRLRASGMDFVSENKILEAIGG